MNQPREFHEAITGEQLFGCSLGNTALSAFEIYTADEANLIELFRWGQRLVDGGPPVDLELLHRLKSERKTNSAAAEQMKTLMQYANWYRTHHALVLARRSALREPDPQS